MLASAALTAAAAEEAAAPSSANATVSQTEDCSQLTGQERKDCVYRRLFRVQNQQIKVLTERLEALYAQPEETTAEPVEATEPPVDFVAPAPVHAPFVDGNGADVSGIESQKLTAQVHMEKETNRFWLTLAVAFAGAAFLFVSLHHMSKVALASSGNTVAPSDVMNVVALHLIVFGILLVVMTADVTDQLTAAAGILGALAGYIFRGVNETTNARETGPANAAPAPAPGTPLPPNAYPRERHADAPTSE